MMKTSEIDNNKKLILHISGGTTSQILSCYLGYFLSKETGRDVIYDLSTYHNGYHFPYALDFFYFDIQKIIYKWCSHNNLSEKCYPPEHIKLFDPTFIVNSRFSTEQTLKACLENADKDVINLVGDEGSSKLNLKYFEEFKKMLVPKYNLLFLDKFKEKIKDKITVAVFARRGEYTTLGWNSGFEYFQAGINYFNQKYSNVEFYIFSDNIDEVKEGLGNCDSYHYVKIIGGADAHIEALLCLSCCSHSLIGPTTWGYFTNIFKDDANAEHIRYVTNKENVEHYTVLNGNEILFDNNDVEKYLKIQNNNQISTKIDNVSDIIKDISILVANNKIDLAYEKLVDLCFDFYYVTLEQRDELTSLFECICILKQEWLRVEQSLIEHKMFKQDSVFVYTNLAMINYMRNKTMQSLIYAVGTTKLDNSLYDEMKSIFETPSLQNTFVKLEKCKKMHFIVCNTTDFSFFQSHKDGLVTWLKRMGHEVSIINRKIHLADFSENTSKTEIKESKPPYKTDTNIKLYTIIKDNSIPESQLDINGIVNIIANKEDLPSIVINRNFNFDIKSTPKMPVIYWDFSVEYDAESSMFKMLNNTMQEIDMYMCKSKPYVITTDKSKVSFFKKLVGDKVFSLKPYAKSDYKITNEQFEFEETQVHDDEFLNFLIELVYIANQITD